MCTHAKGTQQSSRVVKVGLEGAGMTTMRLSVGCACSTLCLIVDAHARVHSSPRRPCGAESSPPCCLVPPTSLRTRRSVLSAPTEEPRSANVLWKPHGEGGTGRTASLDHFLELLAKLLPCRMNGPGLALLVQNCHDAGNLQLVE